MKTNIKFKRAICLISAALLMLIGYVILPGMYRGYTYTPVCPVFAVTSANPTKPLFWRKVFNKQAPLNCPKDSNGALSQ
jgi:hypothetical protein